MSKIDITGTDLRKFVAKAYELSQPQGMGFLHFTEGPLDEATISAILDVRNPGYCLLNMDYVHGRSVKLGVYVRDGRWLINSRWYDHTARQLHALLAADGVVNNGEYVEAT